MRNFLPKSLFGILLAFITGLFLIFALVTGSMTWTDSKQRSEAVLESKLQLVIHEYNAGNYTSTKKPAGLKPGPPYFQKKTREIGREAGYDLHIFHNPTEYGEVWVQINKDAWFLMPSLNYIAVWAKNFAPKLGLMAVLIAFSALFLAHTIKAPLAKLTTALAQFQRTHHAPDMEGSGPKELQNVTHQVNDMMHEINSFEEQRELVLAGVAHDIRTPLARIRVAIEMIPQLADDKRNALINDIEQINHLQQQFLNYTRSGTSGEKQKVDLNGILTECINQYPENDIITDLSQEEILVSAETGQLFRAFENVFNNAFTYGEAPVHVKTEKIDSMAVITIYDQGEGVPEDALPHLTQPLFRGDAARGDCEGTGLGLAIVACCVNDMGGQLEITNAEQKGLLVTLKLPCSIQS